ncbi:MAG: RluA family pseudouridine synthase [Lachnospiraceae bacterium]|nr:RluA family pseudouridine synthase [Lachnospiraceae bacterium]
MELLTIVVEEDLQGERADKAIAAMMPELTRSYAQKLIASGCVTKNGSVLSKDGEKMKTGDILVLALPEPETLSVEPENIPLDIVYEDDALLVVNKPKGMVVHPAPGHSSGTLVNALMYHCEGRLSGINGVVRPGIVHRIDRDTTGLLVVCKTDAAHLALSEQMAVHSITRVYSCICEGEVKEAVTIDAPIGRSPNDRKKMAIVKGGRRAVTHVTPLRVLRLPKCTGRYTYAECRLETGRTHQIRVHMASIQRPLLGDTVYGREKQPFDTQGQVLHAGVLGFVHPISGEYVEFRAPLPEYFQKLLDSGSDV